ncbi:unnamed protein product [Hermetia illucens]|uniref:Peptidase S1 domain-containing protein n=1 Tax=Hermetia illucens TaxID=343691 RepID=A0A7R8YWD4_HERIL|nr:chymotrypsin-like protease CTRL-1 [Hermetia illucens]CAD7087229.1 unnamed protein product [Hermetia illucens]
MKAIILLLVFIRLCLAKQLAEPSDLNKVDPMLEDLLRNENLINQRISAGVASGDLRENDYMPDALKDLIMQKMAKMPGDMGWNRVFGGQVAPRGAYPHQVGMSLMTANGGSSWCGGSVLSETYVLTAAHCLDNVYMASMIFGAHDRMNSAEPGRVTQTVTRANFIVHRGWNPQNMLNDIALIRLNQRLQFTNLIKPISILSSPYESYEGQTAIVSGWGHYDATSQLARHLRHAQSVVANNALCQQYFGHFITNNNVCLDGSRGQGACNGDSGGPLINTKGQLIGLVSFGSGQGCDRRWPTVYTKIASYKTWITQNSGIRFV